jgi:hypothetical protein
MLEHNPDSDKTDWQTVKKEIIDQVRKDLRSKEVLSGLEESNWKRTIGRIFQHPAFLVLLTFVVTSLVGTQITSSWQSKQRELDQKYGLIDLVNRGVSDNLTAAQDIVGLYQYEQGASDRTEIEKERWAYWQAKSREWRVNSNVIPYKLKGNFKDPEIQRIFRELLNTSFGLNIDIKNLKGEVAEKGWELVATPEFSARLRDFLKTIQSLRVQMALLLDRMTTEVNLSWWQRSSFSTKRFGIPARFSASNRKIFAQNPDGWVLMLL